MGQMGKLRCRARRGWPRSPPCLHFLLAWEGGGARGWLGSGSFGLQAGRGAAAPSYPALSFSFLSVMPSLDTSLLNTRIPMTMFTCGAGRGGCGGPPGQEGGSAGCPYAVVPLPRRLLPQPQPLRGVLRATRSPPLPHPGLGTASRASHMTGPQAHGHHHWGRQFMKLGFHQGWSPEVRGRAGVTVRLSLPGVGLTRAVKHASGLAEPRCWGTCPTQTTEGTSGDLQSSRRPHPGSPRVPSLAPLQLVRLPHTSLPSSSWT